MANHVRRQLREAVAVAVTGLATTASRVFQSRSYALQAAELPCLLVATDGEEAEMFVVTAPLTYERVVALRITGVAKATADLDDTLDAIAKEVEVALAAGVTVSSKLIDLIYTGCTIEIDTESEKPAGSVTLNFAVKLYTAAATPDVLT